MFSATENGLGTCWFKSDDKLRKILGAAKDEEMVSSIIIGYPKKDHKHPVIKRKKLKKF